ncbi:unnamed protein product [Rotaria sp. Silwood2]|nr:unnamed protein product [Rotaria sp. Silwood2]CAF4689405.1 unnamed protein product [Rotaria sp. Silwood2]
MPLVFLPMMEAFIAHYGMVILFLFGNIGNVFIILLFYQYRKNAWSIYLSSGTIINIIYLTFDIPIFIYTYFHDEPIPYSLVFCKLRFYLSHVFGQMARYLFVLACFDRYILTSRNFHLRNFNRSINAKCSILLVIIFWCIICSHQLIFTTMNNQQCGQFGIYHIINSVYLFISFLIIPSVLMIIFGYLACHQMKQFGSKIRPLTNNQNGLIIITRRDRELLLMILTQIFIFCLTTIFYLAISLELLITISRNENKSIERIQIENFILILSTFFIYMNHAAAFYIYMIVSKGFRHDFKKLLKKCCKQPITASVIEQR